MALVAEYGCYIKPGNPLNKPKLPLTFFQPRNPSSPVDGFGHFEIDLPHQGLVRLARPLDYETNREFRLTIVANVSWALFPQ